MAGSFGSNDDDVISGINVTPLVDVVLVLLIIFLITAPVIYQSTIKVQLPKATSGEAAGKQKNPLQFTLTKEGDLMWEKEKVVWAAVPSRLTQLTQTGQNLQEETASISADTSTPHGTVIKLMDILRNAGLTRFALNVESQQPSK